MKNKITYTHIYTKHETIYMLNWTRVMTQWVSMLQSQGRRREPVAKSCPLTCSHVSWHAHHGCLTQVQQLQGLHALNHWKRASPFLWERGCLSVSYVASILLGLAPFVCFLNLPSQCMTVVFGVDLSLPPTPPPFLKRCEININHRYHPGGAKTRVSASNLEVFCQFSLSSSHPKTLWALASLYSLS